MATLSLRGTPQTREVRAAYLLLAPTLVFFLAFQYYPILKSIAISFTEYGLLRRSTPFVGLENYILQLQDPLFLSALVLFLMTFVLNTAAELVRQRFRKRALQL